MAQRSENTKQYGRLSSSTRDRSSSYGEDVEPFGGAGEKSAAGKTTFQPYHANVVPKSENLETRLIQNSAKGGNVTTMMLRNIPNKYTQSTLMQELNDNTFDGCYNFFYLPMDIHNRSNVGYAFINFNTSEAAQRFLTTFAEHRFQRFQSRKIGSVCVAHVQGLDANLRHFENRAVTQARNDQYRPVVLQGQRRIPFEEAVMRAKAASPSNAMAPQQQKQYSAQSSQRKQDQLQKKQQQRLERKEKQQAANARTAAKVSVREPAIETGDVVEPNARQALEASICAFLEDKIGHDANCAPAAPVQAAPQLVGDDMLESSYVAGAGATNISQLLALRSLIDERLQERGVSVASIPAPPGLGGSPVNHTFMPMPRDSPAYVQVNTDALKGDYIPEALGDGDSTPRNNGLALGAMLDIPCEEGSRSRSNTQ